MIRKVIEFSVHHPVSVIMGFCAFMILSFIALAVIPVDFYPDIPERKALVVTEFPNLSAVEVRELLTIPLEDALGSLKGIRDIHSVSRDGVSIISLDIKWGIPIESVLVDVREIIDSVYVALPSGTKKPIATRDDSIRGESFILAVHLSDTDLFRARTLVENDIRQRIQRIEGVRTVTIAGGLKEEFHITINPARTIHRGMSVHDIAGIINQSNYQFPAGQVISGDNEILLKTNSVITSIEEARNIPVGSAFGSVSIGDISVVSRSSAERSSFFMVNGVEAVRVGVTYKNGVSPIRISNNIKKEISRNRSLYGNSVSFNIIDDKSDQVKETFLSLSLIAAAGMLISFFVVYFGLGSSFLAMVVSSMIPLSAMAVVFVLKVLGRSVNTVSITGVAIGIGLVIDSGLISVESIKTHSKQLWADRSSVICGTQAIIASNFGSASTTIIVFLPVLFMSGLVNQAFSDLTISIITTIAASCVMSFTLIPALIVVGPVVNTSCASDSFFEKVSSKYCKILHKITKPKFFIPVFFILSLLPGLSGIFILRFEMMPSITRNRIDFLISMDPELRLEGMKMYVHSIFDVISDTSKELQVTAFAGMEKDDYPVLNNPLRSGNQVLFSVSFPERLFTEEMINKIRSDLQKTPFEVLFIEEKDVFSNLLGIDIGRVIVTGTDPDDARQRALRYVGDRSMVLPEYRTVDYVFTPDRTAAARFNVSLYTLAEQLQGLVRGVQTAPIVRDGLEIPVLVKLPAVAIDSLEKLSNIPLKVSDGVSMPARVLGNFSQQESDKILYRYNRKDARILKSYSGTHQAPDIVSLSDEQVKQMMLDAAVIIAGVLLLLYVLLGAQFESFIFPFVLLMAVPPALSGAILLMVITNTTMNIYAVIAMIILFGTAVNGSIILWESVHSTSDHKPAASENEVLDRCSKKIRPILLTVLTTVAALLPFTFKFSGSGAQVSLAITLIGGLLVSTVTILLIMPFVLSSMFLRRLS